MSGQYVVVPSDVMSDSFEVAWRDEPRSWASIIDWVGIIFSDRDEAQMIADALNKQGGVSHDPALPNLEGS